MTRDWKRKGNPTERLALFCPKCQKCMYTKEDVRSRDERGFCSRCSSEGGVGEFQPDVITIVIGEGA